VTSEQLTAKPISESPFPASENKYWEFPLPEGFAPYRSILFAVPKNLICKTSSRDLRTSRRVIHEIKKTPSP
jgi:hypothetical protein